MNLSTKVPKHITDRIPPMASLQFEIVELLAEKQMTREQITSAGNFETNIQASLRRMVVNKVLVICDWLRSKNGNPLPIYGLSTLNALDLHAWYARQGLSPYFEERREKEILERRKRQCAAQRSKEAREAAKKTKPKPEKPATKPNQCLPPIVVSAFDSGSSMVMFNGIKYTNSPQWVDQ